MANMYLVLLKFKQDVAAATRRGLLQGIFFFFPQKCRGQSQSLYIKGIRAGSEDSPATDSHFSTFIVIELDSIEQRGYYKFMDPIHANIVSRIWPLTNNVTITAIQENGFNSDDTRL
ncbi:hypothetical protein ASPTUDRAFT_190448 [Aspergillus tubingensis CBS 134.48]|uniref:Uncharacterized protein n=1 Tax=Aspergillus tubingensis (strain CBS 134.48) TaxID=767770 RepID=A0A1L9N462_ASPTC|nr:hypothetical protein ASPTUDRAFT_190448 [Aspergillus tubingensis CBS 134.48]